MASAILLLLSEPAQNILGSEMYPFTFLLGPVVCLFILGVMLKQHIYIHLLDTYIADELGYEAWSRFLSHETLGATWRQTLLSVFLGGWEFLTPVLVGSLYLAASAFTAYQMQLPAPQALWSPSRWVWFTRFFYLDCALLIVAFVILIVTTRWLWYRSRDGMVTTARLAQSE